jgi:hypothetical protein
MKKSKTPPKNKKNLKKSKPAVTSIKGLDRLLNQANASQVKEVKKLLAAKSPDKYIDLSVKSDLPSNIKGVVTREWVKQNGYTIENIKYARNRHPYWKDKKQTNHTERTRKRFEQFNFSGGDNRKWTKDELSEFIKINDKFTDRELAEHFTRSIPSIQGIRRRINLGVRILEAQGEKSIKKTSLGKFVKIDEKVLRRELSKIGK